jgi:hypothetical protein
MKVPTWKQMCALWVAEKVMAVTSHGLAFRAMTVLLYKSFY